MTTQDKQQVNNLLLVVGVDRIGEFTQSLQPEEQTLPRVPIGLLQKL